uniref:SFRICE_008144 n=1 Tax=Spodoptera frugiperda TaxID=7108 RepID=A0A2H1V2H5_SPOFR
MDMVHLIDTLNGKTWALFREHPYFYRYKTKNGHKWVCTTFPRCKSFIFLDDDNNLLDIETSRVKLITMLNGKQLVVYKGYTFYNQYAKKGPASLDRWRCTSQPRCKCFLILDKSLVIHEAQCDHMHPKKTLIKNHCGRNTLLLV